jgi:hypothetical protein
MELISDYWRLNQRLQDASENRAAMCRGERDHAAVALLQWALINTRYLNLPSTTALGTYEDKTAAAVRAVELKNASRW